MMKSQLSMCACHAHPSVQSAFLGVHCFVRSAFFGAHRFVSSAFLGAHRFVRCVCILCTLLLLSSCEKPITNADSVVSGSAAD